MPRRKKLVTSIGCGIIGQAWSIVFAAKGYETRLYHPRPERLQQARKNIVDTLRFLENKEILKQSSVEDTMSKIIPVSDLKEALAEVQFVQESLPERQELKQMMFKEMARNSSQDTILSSSTSSLSMSEIQKVALKPGRCITAHPFNPPYFVPLVEIVPGKLTTRRTIERTYDFFSSSLDRIPIIVKKEVRGFIGNRLAAALWREAIDLVAKGVVSAEEVDKAIYAGLGLRWAIMGQNLIYTINGGEGGIPAFLERYGEGYSKIWKSMDSWKEIGPERSAILWASIKKMLRGKSYEQLVKERDEKLALILRCLWNYEM